MRKFSKGDEIVNGEIEWMEVGWEGISSHDHKRFYKYIIKTLLKKKAD
jgi:acetone carboxylase gamma subunit